MNKLFCFLTCTFFCFATKFNYAPNISSTKEEKPIVIIVPSYNNEKFYLENLKSIVMQKYTNFRVIYTNDASTDDTGKLVQEFMVKHFDADRFIYIENNKNMGALYNIYQAVHSCNDEEIICLLDGDDKLSHSAVLQRLNQAYADDHVWMTYGQDSCKIRKRGHSRPTPIKILEEGRHRECRWIWSHLRTFYAGLFKLVPDENWLVDGEFYPVASDVAILLFNIDMAREHVYFIPEVQYIYNVDNPLNDYKLHLRRQQQLRKYIWGLKPLDKLNSKEDFIRNF